MIFSSVTAENFFAIGTKTTWRLKDQGLVLIVGENHDSSSSDSNGSGKSTMFEALVWALWGKTVRGLTGDGVINRKAGKNCRVTVWIEYEEQTYEVERCRKFGKEGNTLTFKVFEDQENGGINLNDLTQGTPTLTQKKIDAFLGIDFQTFIHGPMLPQGSFKKFSELTDSEQKDILERAVQIGVLRRAKEVVRERLSAAVSKQATSEAAIHRDQGALYDTWKDLQEYYDGQTSFAKHLRKELTRLMKQIVNLIFAREDIRDREPVLVTEEQVRIARTNLEKEEKAKEACNKDWERTRKRLEMGLIEVRSNHRSITKELLSAKERQRSYEDTKEKDTCPTCGQEVDGKTVDGLLESLDDLEVKLTIVIDQYAEKIHELEDEMESQRGDYQKKIYTIEQDIKQAYQTLVQTDQATKTHSNWETELNASLEQELVLRDLCRRKQKTASPFDKLAKDCEEKAAALLKALGKEKMVLRHWELEVETLEFWQKGFSNRGLKSHILDSVTPFMNNRVLHYIQTLSSGELTITFSTQTQLKNGEVKEQFNVTVTNQNGADTYAGNSGGEKGRADLAINFTLSDLVSSRARKAYPQRFFDEPFEGLDESGVEAVMDLLANMAKEAGSIFVITHQDGMKGRFDKTIKVVKRDGFSQMAA